jgi:hypothetical protein
MDLVNFLVKSGNGPWGNGKYIPKVKGQGGEGVVRMLYAPPPKGGKVGEGHPLNMNMKVWVPPMGDTTRTTGGAMHPGVLQVS